jgi:hypothetical protein
MIGDGMTRTRPTNRAIAGCPSRTRLLARRLPVDLTAAVALTCLSALASVAAQTESPGEIIAAQIRTQGFACSAPVTATRDQAASQPNAAVWVLSCGNARYQVRLVPNMAAQVTQLK